MLTRTDAGKRHYLRGLFVTAVLSWAAWIILYTVAFGHGVAESADDLINQLLASPSDDSRSGGSEAAFDVGQAFLAVSFLAEAAISALVWLVIEHIVSMHAGATSVANPEWITLDRSLTEVVAQRRLVAEQQRGDLAERSTLESQLALHADATLAELRRLESISPQYIRAIVAGGENLARPSHPATLNGAHS
ncbi:MAG: hypothetical protein AB7Q00_11525 [Phycisphaerales bacterium]